MFRRLVNIDTGNSFVVNLPFDDFSGVGVLDLSKFSDCGLVEVVYILKNYIVSGVWASLKFRVELIWR